jgi:hypothetical protein
MAFSGMSAGKKGVSGWDPGIYCRQFESTVIEVLQYGNDGRAT